MSGINNFPDDNNLWLVKWIDQIRLAHLTTQSASFSVLIQKLSISDPKLIHRGTQLLKQDFVFDRRSLFVSSNISNLDNIG